MYVRRDIPLYTPQNSWMQSIATIGGAINMPRFSTASHPENHWRAAAETRLNATDEGLISNLLKINLSKEGTCDGGLLLGCIRATIPLMVNQGLDRRVYSFLCSSIELSRNR